MHHMGTVMTAVALECGYGVGCLYFWKRFSAQFAWSLARFSPTLFQKAGNRPDGSDFFAGIALGFLAAMIWPLAWPFFLYRHLLPTRATLCMALFPDPQVRVEKRVKVDKIAELEETNRKLDDQLRSLGVIPE
jgi:hypothetical protein